MDTDPSFSGPFGVLLVQNISRSDYTLVSDLAPGTYYWRVRAQHGLVYGPWSAGVNFSVVAPPPTPAGLNLFWLLTEPSSVSGGASTKARVSLRRHTREVKLTEGGGRLEDILQRKDLLESI